MKERRGTERKSFLVSSLFTKGDEQGEKKHATRNITNQKINSWRNPNASRSKAGGPGTYCCAAGTPYSLLFSQTRAAEILTTVCLGSPSVSLLLGAIHQGGLILAWRPGLSGRWSWCGCWCCRCRTVRAHLTVHLACGWWRPLLWL